MGLIRDAIAKSEKSVRVIELTTDIIRANPSHYSVWKLRQDLLFVLDYDLKAELDFVTGLAEQHPKSYQIWNHRQILVNHRGNAEGERAFVNNMLDLDSKNYHAWAYRQWLCKRFAAWDDEVADVNHFIDDDIRNNSALSLLFNGEIHSEIELICEEYAVGATFVTFAAALLVDALTKKAVVAGTNDKEAYHSRMDELLLRLIQTDSIRQRYWEYKRKSLVIAAA
ncbi:CAAX geranylgeranyltransferase alpha subunit [Phlyctochytrium bullatum]|nr:CAAX geranylgeranyltransferase alpha subunit [Phlyctochytrium bullatum]